MKIEKAIEDLKERVIFMEDFLKEKESMGTIVLDKEKILNSIALNKLAIIALEKQIELNDYLNTLRKNKKYQIYDILSEFALEVEEC